MTPEQKADRKIWSKLMELTPKTAIIKRPKYEIVKVKDDTSK